jgi:membrane protein implicated in regulation of membrane protease activity
MGRFAVPGFPRIERGLFMHSFGFLFSVRFWIAVWILVLFVGLLPLPPAAELVIVVGLVSHIIWFVRGYFRRLAQRRALARSEKAQEEEYRRLRRRRSPQG